MFVATDNLANNTVAFQPETFAYTGSYHTGSSEYQVNAYWNSVRGEKHGVNYGLIGLTIDHTRIQGNPQDLTFEQMLPIASHEKDSVRGYVAFRTVHKIGWSSHFVYPDWFDRYSRPSKYSKADHAALLATPMTLPAGADGWYHFRSGWIKH